MDTPYSDLNGFKPYMLGVASRLRKCMVSNGFEFKCSTCGITEWMGRPAPLQIDHINGVRADCTKGNLRFLCPNCHAFTDTFAGKNRKLSPERRFTKEKVMKTYSEIADDGLIPSITMLSGRMGVRIRNAVERSTLERICADLDLEIRKVSVQRTSTANNRGGARPRIQWPSDDALEALLKKHPRTEVAKMLGVSDVAVKKHCKRYGIKEPDYHRFSTEVVSRQEAARKEREAVNKAERRRRAKLDRLERIHGTLAGYRLELRLKLEPCDACRAANADSVRKYRT